MVGSQRRPRSGTPGNLATWIALPLLVFGARPALATEAMGQIAPLERLALPRLQLTPLVLGQSTPAAGNGLDFDLLGDSKPPERSAADLEKDHQEKVRRQFLTLHQIVGLSTLTLMAATVLIGQLEYLDQFGGTAPNTGRYETAHEVLATITLVGFAGTGALGLFAPVPYPRKTRLDTTFVHRLCMAGAALGMMTELGLGFYTASHTGFSNQQTLGEVHQVIGFSTFGLMGIGAGAFLF